MADNAKMTVDPSMWYSDDEMLKLLAGQYRLVDVDGGDCDEEFMAEEFLCAIDSNGHEVSNQWYIDRMNEFLEDSTTSGLKISAVMIDENEQFHWKLVP